MTDDEDDAEELLALDVVTVADDELLGVWIDALIFADAAAHDRAAHIAEHLEWLRAAVDAPTWPLVLEIEARANERFTELTLLIARAAFEQGRRCACEPKETSS